MQFMMLNQEKLFSEAEGKSKVEDFVHFDNDLFLSKNDILLVFRIFRPEKKVH